MTIEHTLEQEKMEALKLIADANMKVSAAKTALISLKNEESTYLADREKKALELVSMALKDSQGLLSVAYANYDGIKELHKSVSELVAWILEAHSSVKSLIDEFKELKELLYKDVQSKLEDIALKRRDIEADMVRIANDRIGIKRQNELIQSDRAKIEDERLELSRAIKRLKEGKI